MPFAPRLPSLPGLPTAPGLPAAPTNRQRGCSPEQKQAEGYASTRAHRPCPRNQAFRSPRPCLHSNRQKKGSKAAFGDGRAIAPRMVRIWFVYAARMATLSVTRIGCRWRAVGKPERTVLSVFARRTRTAVSSRRSHCAALSRCAKQNTACTLPTLGPNEMARSALPLGDGPRPQRTLDMPPRILATSSDTIPLWSTGLGSRTPHWG